MSRREIRRKFDEIVDFAGVGEFVDTPLKRYSSGMTVRLGFAIAAHLDQEILLVDEVLSVGDAAFREKCLGKMGEMTARGRTVLFVGHNLEMISTSCRRAIWLQKGKIVDEGSASQIVRRYENMTTARRARHGGLIILDDSLGVRRGQLVPTHVRLLDGDGAQVPEFSSGQTVRLAIGYRVADGSGPSGVAVKLAIKSAGGYSIASCENACVGELFRDLPRRGEMVCELDRLPLAPGRYKLGLSLWIDSKLTVALPEVGEIRVSEGSFYPTGKLPASGSGHSLLRYRWSVSQD
jgi:lipopolysaccharide transport system ATP-binding protein